MTDEPNQIDWPQATPPTAERCWRWSPTDLRDLSRVRREFRTRVCALRPLGPVDRVDLLDDAVTALDELMSNALRHGRAPVVVEVCQTGDDLLLLVGDAAADDPPQPTAVRDPGQGGMGLGIVARTCLARGWTRQAGVKTIWALMPA